MADSADLASERETADRAAAVAAVLDRPRPAGKSAYLCNSCRERIPDARREAVPGTNVCGFCARHLTGAR